MREILIKIADILWTLPNSNETVVATIMNPIDNTNQANRLLEYLKENKNNKEVMRIGYLIKYNHEIIGS